MAAKKRPPAGLTVLAQGVETLEPGKWRLIAPNPSRGSVVIQPISGLVEIYFGEAQSDDIVGPIQVTSRERYRIDDYRGPISVRPLRNSGVERRVLCGYVEFSRG